jgi:hypothetical protein
MPCATCSRRTCCAATSDIDVGGLPKRSLLRVGAEPLCVGRRGSTKRLARAFSPRLRNRWLNPRGFSHRGRFKLAPLKSTPLHPLGWSSAPRNADIGTARLHDRVSSLERAQARLDPRGRALRGSPILPYAPAPREGCALHSNRAWLNPRGFCSLRASSRGSVRASLTPREPGARSSAPINRERASARPPFVIPAPRACTIV